MNDIIITRLDVNSEGNETVISVPISEATGLIRILPISLRAIMTDSRVSAATAAMSMRFACNINEYYSRFDNFIPLMREKHPNMKNLTESMTVAEYMAFYA